MNLAWPRLFTPAPARGLALARVVLYGGLFLLYLPLEPGLWGGLDPVFWQPLWPLPAATPPPGPALAGIVGWIFKAALLTTCLGILPRLSAATAAATGLFVLGLANQWGVTFHTDAAVALLLLMLAPARLGDDLTLPELLRERRAAAAAAPAPSGEYRWPLVAARVVLCLVFAAAGLSKVLDGGWEWVATDSLARTLLKQSVTSDPWLDATWIAAIPIAYHGMAAATVVIELAYPLALVWRRGRPWLVAAGLLLLLGFAALAGPSFPALALAHLWWLPWERLSAAGRDAA